MLQPPPLRVLALIAGAAIVTACGQPSIPLRSLAQVAQSASHAPGGIDWRTFGFSAQRWSYNPYETILTASSVKNLKLKYAFKLGNISNAQPLLASDVKLANGHLVTAVVYAADESSNLYAVNDTAGTAIWSKALGRANSPCWSHGSNGITSAPAIDRATNRIYVLDGAGTLSAFDLGTGKQSAGFPPMTAFKDPLLNHTWSGLLLNADGSTLYYPTASHCDSGTYFGTINAVDTATQKITTFQLVTQKKQYYGNGVWSWGGEAADPDDGNLFAGVGNSLGTLGERGKYSDSVIELTPSLGFVGDEQPENDLQGDTDIGTTPVPFDDGSSKCAAFERKDGNFFSIDRTNLRNGRYVSKLALGGNLATPAYSPANGALYAAVPNGLTKLAIGANCALSIAWQTPIGATGYSVPAVAKGVVYAAGGNTLYAVDASSGAILWSSGSTISGTITAEPTVANGRVYVTSWDKHLYVFGL